MKTSALFDRGRMRWYPRDPVAWWEKTKDLEVEEVGVYDRLMDLMYMHGCPIPDGWGHAGVAVFGLNASKNKAKVWKRIRQKLIDLDFIYVDENGCLAQKRVLEELDSYQKKREKASESGRKGGRKRKEQSVSSAEQTLSSSEQASSKLPASTQQSVSSEQKLNENNASAKATASETLKGTPKQNIEEEYSVSEAKAPDTSLPELFANAHNSSSMLSDRNNAVALFQAAALRCGWRKLGKLSEDRQKKLDGHLRKRGGLANWRREVAASEAMTWTHGDHPRPAEHKNWKFSLDDMFTVKHRNRLDDALASMDDAATDDPFAMERWACEKRRSDGRWVGGYNEADISATVRAEFPELFTEVAA